MENGGQTDITGAVPFHDHIPTQFNTPIVKQTFQIGHGNRGGRGEKHQVSAILIVICQEVFNGADLCHRIISGRGNDDHQCCLRVKRHAFVELNILYGIAVVGKQRTEGIIGGFTVTGDKINDLVPIFHKGEQRRCHTLFQQIGNRAGFAIRLIHFTHLGNTGLVPTLHNECAFLNVILRADRGSIGGVFVRIYKFQ